MPRFTGTDVGTVPAYTNALVSTTLPKIQPEIVDNFFTATPFPGIPWMEAMLGCDVYSTESSFMAHATGENLEDVHLQNLIRVEWFDKYLEFTRMLQKLGNARFPVGQPIMRGPTSRWLF